MCGQPARLRDIKDGVETNNSRATFDKTMMSCVEPVFTTSNVASAEAMVYLFPLPPHTASENFFRVRDESTHSVRKRVAGVEAVVVVEYRSECEVNESLP